MEEEKRKRKILKKLKNKYRLVILNDASFEEKFSYRLSPLNIVTLVLTFAVFLMGSVAVIIIFTPLREYIPGYTDVSLREDLTNMVLRSDSLEHKLQQNNLYLANLQAILRGEDPHTEDLLAQDSSLIDSFAVDEAGNPAIKAKEDSLLRDYVEREDSYSLKATSASSSSSESRLYYFTPLKGTVTNTFNQAEAHFGVDIVAPKNEAIKAALDGTVIFADWTVETGYVIQLQHKNNITSIYKHNSVLLKEVGQRVKAGEAIAIIGNTGKLSSGPHLHFELWKEGKAIDPMQFINFN
ncbi:MAG: peptidase M23 [Flavobacteriales bacterium]|nr:peptidase M23 [Flavobacteriales bacterium]|tara:strand:+ start:160 stop:1047 length:888 start_codon:yes stop_codon:yes gene_type:complete